MKNKLKISAFALMMAGTSVLASNVTVVGGENMYSSRNIIENAVNSKDHTTLVAAVKAAGLVETLEGPGKFTVFAPTNNAFNALPPGKVDNLLKSEYKAELVKVLTYHVVQGNLKSDDLRRAIKRGGGKAELKTVNGETLTVLPNGEHNIILKDSKGDIANIATYDVVQSNGVIHSIDTVLLP
jgi:uncharacterized surface protein with fasciclin (FAS1) repeats